MRAVLSLSLGFLALPAAAASCVGQSASLPAAQCAAYGDFYDSTNGHYWSNQGQGCSREDPCACGFGTNEGGGVTCGAHGTKLQHIVLGDSNLQGTLPPSMSALTDLTRLELQNNDLRGGLLPDMNFTSHRLHKSCFLLEAFGSNRFLCPWPPGATTACLKVNANDDYLPITDSDCHGTAPPTPPTPPTPPPTPPTYRCTNNTCVMGDTGLPKATCEAVCGPARAQLLPLPE